ncbi:MAG: hypothetical protein L0H29_03505 [Sinobacteraceae bacterium]|nr:hypothetical protein [Nevskiaceae bacterium]
MNSGQLARLALEFRDAIERTPRDVLPVTFAQFPRGSCGDASLILARYLADCGQTGFALVSAWRGTAQRNDRCSHAWLERRGLVVDVTGDQFPEFGQRVFVGVASPFHRTFAEQERGSASLAAYDERTASTLARACAEVCKRLSP